MRLNLKTLTLGAVATAALASCSGGSQDSASEGNAALNNIMSRTSVREYTAQPVGADTVEILLKAAMAATTAANARPWKFVVVRNEAMRAELGDSLPNAGDKLTKSAFVVVVCGDSETFFKPQPDFWVQDCSAATENLLLAANAVGLGAVWCGIYPDMNRVYATRQVLGLSPELIPLCVVPVGHPASAQEPKDKWNPDNVIYKD